MNQAIQFPDREEWDAKEQAILFPALVNGMQLMCVIKGDVLLRRFGGCALLRKIAGISRKRPAISSMINRRTIRGGSGSPD